MFARSTRFVGVTDEQQATEQYRQALERFREMEGNGGAFLLVQRGAGIGVGVTLWNDEQAMANSREQAEQLRQRAAGEAGAQVERVEEWEVAVWDVKAS